MGTSAKQEKIVSIIIPVYNALDDLKICLDSFSDVQELRNHSRE